MERSAQRISIRRFLSKAKLRLAIIFLVQGAMWGQGAPPSYDFVKNGIREAHVDSVNGIPRLIINGQPVPPLIFFFNNGVPDRIQLLAPQMKDANAAGIHVFSLFFFDWPWDPGDATHPPDYSAPNAEMDQFLKTDPQAVFLLRIPVDPPTFWSGWATHSQWGKTDDILFSDGTTDIGSIASDRYLQAFLTSVGNMIQHYEASSYAPHILGYHIAGQHTDEWFPKQYWEKSSLDYSPVNTTAFRNWLQQKYGNDAALSQAWGRTVTISAAPIPIPAPGRFPIHGAAIGDPVQAFYTLPAEQDWVDYSDYTSDIFSSRILTIAHTVRTATGGKRLIAFFNGYIYELPGSMNGHLRMDRLLASPDIDMIAAPISYYTIQERLAGGAGASMSARDSVALHGKLWMNEDDLRTYLAANLPDLFYGGVIPTADFFETNNVLQRNLASVLVHRGGTWWMDLNPAGAFNDPNLWNSVMGAYGLPLYDQLYASPAPYLPEVAVITDERSVLYQASDLDFLNIPRAQLRNAIAKVGASIGYYDLSDFISGALRPAKVYVFVNAFHLTDDQIAAIRSRLESEGSTAIWQYAPGYLGPTGPDVTRCSALTGIQLAVSSGFSGSIGAGYLADMAWGWALNVPWTVLSPRLVVTDQNVTVLGRYWSDSAVSTAYKQVNEFNSVFVGDVGWNTDMIRLMLISAGVHIWSDAGDVIHTDGSLLVIHAAAAGPRSISLPAGVSAVPVNAGPRQTPSTGTLNVTFSRIGETQWFRLGPTTPAVKLVDPANGAVFGSGKSILVVAEAAGVGTGIKQVEFFQSGTSLGMGEAIPIPSGSRTAALFGGIYYVLNWSDPAAGTYSLTAKATDNNGAVAVSSPIGVVIGH